MTSPKRPRRGDPRVTRLVLAGAGLLLVSQGLLALARGDLGWHPYWTGSGLAAFAVLLGVLLLLLVLLEWHGAQGTGGRPGSARRTRRSRATR